MFMCYLDVEGSAYVARDYANSYYYHRSVHVTKCIECL